MAEPTVRRGTTEAALRKPSEFGGKAQKNGIQPAEPATSPFGHTMTASEELRLIYTTGQDKDQSMDPVPGAFKDAQTIIYEE